MSGALFRKEAIAARGDHWLGQALVLRPLAVSLTAGLSTSLVLAVMAYLVFGEYTRRVRLTGLVMPSAGIVRVAAPRAGRIVSLKVADGQTVRAGDTLYTLASDSTTAFGETQMAVAVQLHRQKKELEAEIYRHTALSTIEKDGLEKEEVNLVREIGQITAQIEVMADYVSLLRNVSDKYSQLAEKRLVLEREAFVRLEGRMQKELDLKNLRREAIRLEQRLSEVKMKLAGFDSKSASAISALERQISVIERDLVEGEARRQIKVVAPQTGAVTAILAKAGQNVASGAPLLTILPEKAHLEIHLYGSSSAIGFLRRNAKVLVRYAAFPYQKFGLYPGTVTGFTHVTLRPGDVETPFSSEAPATRRGSGEAGMYRVIVRPEKDHVIAYGKVEPLRSSMAVEADIYLDTRPIYQWLLEPLYSLRGTVSGHGGEA